MKLAKTSVCVAMFGLAILSCKQQKAYRLDRAANANMVHILDSITAINFNIDNPFSPESQLAYFDRQIQKADTNVYGKALAEYYKAGVLLKLGREKDAIELYKEIDNAPHLKKSNFTDMMQVNYALANLRYGERSNCINGHMAESCVFPIEGMGMHHDETGSRAAIKLYTGVLKNRPEDMASRWLLNIAYMTLGEYPAKVPPAFLIPGLDQDSSAMGVKPFTDIAADLKLDTRNKAGGSVIDDFNNDGYLDLITTDWGIADGYMHYFKNNCDGSFTEVTEQAGLGGFRGGLNMVQADYNNDGYTDILVLRGAWLPGVFGKQPNSLLRNNGDGTFTDVTIQSGLLSFHPTQAAVWRDFNNDGWLDLFIGNETSNPNDPQLCELYISNGDGTFTNTATASGCNIAAFVKGVTSADYNNDGLPDLFLSTMDGMRILLKNDGVQNGLVHFSDVTFAAGLADVQIRTFPTWFWDYDNDGWPDIFVCGYQPGHNSIAYSLASEALGHPDPSSSRMYLYHNNRNGTFSNVSVQAGLDHCVFAMGSNFGDIDNDGYLDMFLGTGNPDYQSLDPAKLYRNIGGTRFADITTPARVGNLQKGHGVSFADLDNDGDQDIYEEVGGAFAGDAYYNSLYLNPGQNNNNWICLSLKGTNSNRSALGARIKLTFKENGITRTVYRDENSGGSFGCSPLRREIGIGSATMIDEIAITWPGTREAQKFTNIKPCQFLCLTEGSSKVETADLKTLNFKGQHHEDMHMAGMKM